MTNNVYQQIPILRPRFIRLVFVLYISYFTTSFAALRKLQEATKRDGSLQFLVVGDWGRKGFFNQSAVALQMGRVAEKLEINFVVSTGDNFYDDGLKDVNDPAFEESFMNIYTAKGLQKPWYNVLGNHDYRGDTEALLSPILRKKDHRWFCQRFYVVNAGIAHLFFVDTTPFVDNYFIEVDHSYDWRAVSPRKKYLTHVLKDLESSVKESTAKWKIVIGHHTIRSAGHHGDTKELVQDLLPLLEANDIDFYINGHDHCLEHISSPQSALQYLTSGGGSKAWRGDVKTLNQQDLKFFYDGQGFMSMKLTKTEAELVVYDIFGKILHNWKISKQSHTDM